LGDPPYFEESETILKLEGQVCVVTGAGRGIGRGIALEQARQGGRMALLGRSSDVEATATQIVAEGGEARAYRVDILETRALAEVFEAIQHDLGGVDLLTNNAASFYAIGPIWEVDPDVWWRDIELNVRGTFNCCRAVLPAMLGRASGRIINLTGGGTGTSFPYGSGYGTSKAGVLRLTESVADTLEGTGVKMFALDPGLVRTAMTEFQMTDPAGRKYLGDINELFARGIDVPPSLAGKLSVEIGSGRFDRMTGRMLFAARRDHELTALQIDDIVARDLRSLRVNGTPEEHPYMGRRDR
jgi:NAD(P)-dependent dehydrogenase (short-subunit alcohol dehydrogenase family)